MKNYYKYLISLLFIAFISCSEESEKTAVTVTDTDRYSYHSVEDIAVFLDEIKLHYPDITSIETVGYSESGRVIRALIISDNPGTMEGEPAVRLTGGIHGDEKSGVETLIRYVEYLTSNYSTDPDISNLVNSRYICIIPLLNPDGLAGNSRENSRGVDLNRNFNDALGHWSAGTSHGAYAFSEAETRALRDFSAPKNFSLSITYHTGTVLVNMPFDYGREADGVYPVQYDLVKSYAKTYTKAGTFLSNPDLYRDPYMDEGTINGGNWYVITGSLQDWSYTETKCLDLTIEIADNDPETETGVQQVFIYNRDSITAYISRAGSDVFTGE